MYQQVISSFLLMAARSHNFAPFLGFPLDRMILHVNICDRFPQVLKL